MSEQTFSGKLKIPTVLDFIKDGDHKSLENYLNYDPDFEKFFPLDLMEECCYTGQSKIL